MKTKISIFITTIALLFGVSRTPNDGFGVRRGAVSWDTSQDFGSSPPVRALVKPRPTPSPRHVNCKRDSAAEQ